MTPTNTHIAKVGIFRTRQAADDAIADLKAMGYADDQIGLIVKDDRGNTTRMDGTGMTKAEEGALGGMAVGAAAGAAVGAAVAAGVIPVIGPVLAIGTLGTVLVNAATGAAVTGLAGALVGWGIPEQDAKYIEDELAAGRYLVTVKSDDESKRPEECMIRHGGYNRLTAPPWPKS